MNSKLSTNYCNFLTFALLFNNTERKPLVLESGSGSLEDCRSVNPALARSPKSPTPEPPLPNINPADPRTMNSRHIAGIEPCTVYTSCTLYIVLCITMYIV